MFKPKEKVIFSIKSGFNLKGLQEYELEDKCLQLTNLGNIYISKVDYYQEKDSDFIVYEYGKYKTGLYSEIDEESINVISGQLPFTSFRNGVESVVNLDLVMVIALEDFLKIDTELEESIFEFKGDKIVMITDNTYIFAGKLFRTKDSLIFEGEDNDLAFYIKDMEGIKQGKTRSVIEGYFYSEKTSMIIREIKFIGQLDEIILEGIGLEVILNDKIGKFPKSQPIVYSRLSGRIEDEIYNNSEIFIRRDSSAYIFYIKKTKKELLRRSIRDFKVYRLSDEFYLVYDGDDVFKLYINDYDAYLLGFDILETISERKIGFTKNENPFFIDVDKENIIISSSKDCSIFNIKKSLISEISISGKSNRFYEDFAFVEIKFGDKVIYLYLRLSLLMDISDEIFSEYQQEIFEKASLDEVYENWVKSMSDKIIYNAFSKIYKLGGKYIKKEPKDFSIVEKINFANDLHTMLEAEKRNVDSVTIYLTEILEKNEIRYFETMGVDFDISSLKKIENLFMELRRDLNIDINEIKRNIEMVSFVMLPPQAREAYSFVLKDDRAYQLDYFVKEAYKRLKHMMYTTLPHYIGKVIKMVFEIYEEIYPSYKKIDEEVLKEELISRIRATHMFKQLMFEDDYSVLRKDVIDDLYSLVKFCSMKAESELCFNGGF